MYDLVITGGRVIDPAQGLDGRYDVAFAGGKVAEVAPGIDPALATATVSAAGALVVPGLIDLHTHVYWGGTSLSVRPEPVARRSGATTLVDAGSAGPGNFQGFREFVIEPSAVRILPYLNISFAGIFAFSKSVMVGECSDVRLLDARACLEVAEQHRNLIVGIKVRVGRNTSEGYGVFPLELAVEVAEELALPVMAHIDFPPPRRRDMLERLRPGDVLDRAPGHFRTRRRCAASRARRCSKPVRAVSCSTSATAWAGSASPRPGRCSMPAFCPT
jgi:dihydroorotase